MTKDITGERVRICELTEDGILDGYTFTDCTIVGPAVLLPQGPNRIAGNTLSGPHAETWWTTPSGRGYGAVAVRGCTFEGCVFEGIGWTGPDEFRDMLFALTPVLWSELRLGSNVLTGPEPERSVVIGYGDRQLVKLETREDSQLLLSADLYDAEGQRAAVLHRNAWAYTPNGYAITTAPSALTLTKGDVTVLSAKAISATVLAIDLADFYLPNGFRFRIDADGYVHLDGGAVHGLRVAGSVNDRGFAFLTIDPDSNNFGIL